LKTSVLAPSPVMPPSGLGQPLCGDASGWYPLPVEGPQVPSLDSLTLGTFWACPAAWQNSSKALLPHSLLPT